MVLFAFRNYIYYMLKFYLLTNMDFVREQTYLLVFIHAYFLYIISIYMYIILGTNKRYIVSIYLSCLKSRKKGLFLKLG